MIFSFYSFGNKWTYKRLCSFIQKCFVFGKKKKTLICVFRLVKPLIKPGQESTSISKLWTLQNHPFTCGILNSCTQKIHKFQMQWNPIWVNLQDQAFNFTKKRTPILAFSCQFCKNFQCNFFIEHFRTTATDWWTDEVLASVLSKQGGGWQNCFPSPYRNFWFRKARITKSFNYIHHHDVCFQNVYKYFCWYLHFLMTSLNITQISFLKTPERKWFFTLVFGKWKVQALLSVTYFHSKLLDMNLRSFQKFGQNFLKI